MNREMKREISLVMNVIGLIFSTILLQKGLDRGNVAMCILGSIWGGANVNNILYKNK